MADALSDQEYYQHRARVEAERSRHAACEPSARSHDELAQLYAALCDRPEPERP